MASLSLSLLGSLQIDLDNQPVNGFDSNKVRALLVYLAVEGNRAHSRDVLAALLWPNFPDRIALNNVRYALANLRKVVGDHCAQPPFLLIQNHMLTFNRCSHAMIDTHKFVNGIASDHITDVEKAVSLYRGDFLEGFSVADSVVFEKWLVEKREHFRQLMLIGLQRLADYFERHGDYVQAEVYTRRQITLEPWRERAHQQLMRILACTGQRGVALAQFKTCRQQLAEELAVLPGRDTVLLYEQIREGAFQMIQSIPAFLSTTADVDLPSYLFVGRQAELAWLDCHLNRALDGKGHSVFIAGEAGSGKSALVHAFSQRAQSTYRDLVVVETQCHMRAGLGEAFVPFKHLLRQLGGDVDLLWSTGRITRDHALRLWSVLPHFVEVLLMEAPALIDRFLCGDQLLRRAQIGAPRQALDLAMTIINRLSRCNGASQLDLFEQVARLLQVLSDRWPVVFIIDDVHWMDEQSLSLFAYLGDQLRRHRILVVGTCRMDARPVPPMISGISIEDLLIKCQQCDTDMLLDLSQSDGRAFIHALVDAEPNRLGLDFRERLLRQTRGNPLFASELLMRFKQQGGITQDQMGYWHDTDHLDWSCLPSRVEAVISYQINRLSPQSRAILQIASVMGEYFSAQVIAVVLGTPLERVINFLSGPLASRYYVVEAVGVDHINQQVIARYRFRHQLFQRFIYSSMDDVQRASLHTAVSAAQESLNPEEHSQPDEQYSLVDTLLNAVLN